MAELPTEIVVLALSVVLLIAQVALQAVLVTREFGREWNAGPRDEKLQPKSVFAGRAQRALTNLQETYPAFVGLALALVVTGQAGQWGAFGAWLWLAGRIVYVPLYVFGIPYIRSAAWTVATIGLVVMLGGLVF
jgi:uncharacterized MAPEG superfamily protein